jgi:hypothetical protein
MLEAELSAPLPWGHWITPSSHRPVNRHLELTVGPPSPRAVISRGMRTRIASVTQGLMAPVLRSGARTMIHSTVSETARSSVVAPYLKALRRQVPCRLPILALAFRRRMVFRATSQCRHVILALVPAIADPFRRNHILAVSRHDGHRGGCRNLARLCHIAGPRSAAIPARQAVICPRRTPRLRLPALNSRAAIKELAIWPDLWTVPLGPQFPPPDPALIPVSTAPTLRCGCPPSRPHATLGGTGPMGDGSGRKGPNRPFRRSLIGV